MLVYFALLVLQSIWPVEAHGPIIEGRGTAIDAQTIRVGSVSVQLANLELPALDSVCLLRDKPTNCRAAARSELQAALSYGTVQCSGVDEAPTRAHCVVWADDAHIYAPLILGRMLIAQGLMRAAPDSEWREVEAESKAQKQGMWAFSD